MEGEDVHANQKRPMTSDTAPTIIGGRRSSGSSLPFSLALARSVVKVYLEA